MSRGDATKNTLGHSNACRERIEVAVRSDAEFRENLERAEQRKRTQGAPLREVVHPPPLILHPIRHPILNEVRDLEKSMKILSLDVSGRVPLMMTARFPSPPLAATRAILTHRILPAHPRAAQVTTRRKTQGDTATQLPESVIVKRMKMIDRLSAHV